MEVENNKFIKDSLTRAKAFRKFIQQKLSRISLPDYTVFSIFAVLIGTAAGFAAVFFHDSIEFFNSIFFEQTAEGLYFLGAAAVIILPAIGMLIQSIMILISPKAAKHKGVSEVIKAVALRGGYIPLRTTIFNFIAPVICIGSGGTVGPEGPAAQIGGGISSKLGSLFGLSDSRRRIFTAAGSGAAISAIFNTPLGGVFFALEIILLNDFHTPTFSALILASVTASAISRIFLGNESVFHFQSLDIGNYSDLYLFAVLGLIAGFISIAFIRYSSELDHLFKKKVLTGKIPQWLIMILVGLLVGVAGYFYKEIFGIGYSAINEVLNGVLSWKIVLILFLLKFILVPLVINSGGFGGVFAPSLFMGACGGYLFAVLVNNIWGLDLNPTAFVLVSMGAMLGGINSIPITSIMIIFEMTQEYSIILPLMLAVIVSTTFTRLALRGSVHVKHLEEQGYQISEGRETNLLRSILVEEVKLDEIELIPEHTPLPSLIAKMIESPKNTFYIVNSEGNITGTITETELRPIITEYNSVKDVLVASDVANPQVVTVAKNDNLDQVLRLFSKTNLDQFPVIDSLDHSKIVGSITRQEVLSIYNRESLKVNLADSLSAELKTIQQSHATQIAAGYSIAERNIPSEFVGKSLSELKLRNKYGLEVLMIKQAEEIFDDSESSINILTAEPDYKLKRTDRIIVFGKDENIEKFKKM